MQCGLDGVLKQEKDKRIKREDVEAWAHGVSSCGTIHRLSIDTFAAQIIQGSLPSTKLAPIQFIIRSSALSEVTNRSTTRNTLNRSREEDWSVKCASVESQRSGVGAVSECCRRKRRNERLRLFVISSIDVVEDVVDSGVKRRKKEVGSEIVVSNSGARMM